VGINAAIAAMRCWERGKFPLSFFDLCQRRRKCER
jgi:hypothetical protein